MKRKFTATVSKEGDWFVAQCLEVDVASQGKSEAEALANLEEALGFTVEESSFRIRSLISRAGRHPTDASKCKTPT